MSKDIVLVSHNKNKIKEVATILEPFGYRVLSLYDIGYSDEIEETGTTFKENALIKARALSEEYPYVIADDSGLSITALNNEPGVQSARWLGENTDYQIKNAKVLDLMKDKEDRQAFFTSVIALIINGNEYTFEGVLEGEIGIEAKGANGFGYDPIFYPQNSTKSLAELSDSEKNAISHRGQSLMKLQEFLNEKN